MGLREKVIRRLQGSPAPYVGAPRILLACPDYAAPSGGVRQIYLLADTLRSALGREAYVYHQHRGFRLDWFQHETPVVYADLTQPGANDLVIMPEVAGLALAHYPGTRKVIFNQNAYYTFMNGYTPVPAATPLRPSDHGVVGILTVSADNAAVLAHTFPETPIARIQYPVDQVRLAFRPDKLPQIAFMPRKHADEATQVLNTLALRGALEGFTVAAIDGVSEIEAARMLGESLIFLSFGYPEGFSLPPAEAMARGCLTIGYHGQAATEFMRPEFAWPIATGDILGYIRTVERVLSAWKANPATLRIQAKAASNFIHARYSHAAYVESVRSAWQQFKL
jgi:hypothetical protein